MNKLQNDIPINDKAFDKLNRNNFAINIAKVLLDNSSTGNKESFVFGLYGEWGTGKTSFINLVKNAINDNYQEQRSKTFTWQLGVVNFIFNIIIKSLLIYFVWKFSFCDFILSLSIIHTILNSFTTMLLSPIDLFGLIEPIIKIVLTIYVLLHPTFTINWFCKLINTFLMSYFSKLSLKFKFCNNLPIIVNFAPWNTTSQEVMLKDFFETLKSAIANESCDIRKNETLNIIDKYIKLLCNNLSNGIINNIKNTSLEKIKEELEQELLKSRQKIIIFIDDIDRLSPDEIFVLFKLIKSIANLPEIIYFLSFDRDIVVNALNEYNNGKGQEFLEKIIQVSFHLPKILPKCYESNLIQEFNNFISNHPKIEQEWKNKYASYWNTAIIDGFLDLFKSPRDVVRYFNTLKIVYNPNIHNEVNIIDFMVIIALQVFMPQLYEFISVNSEFFMHNKINEMDTEWNNKDAQFEKIINQYETINKKLLKQLLSTLFPKAGSLSHALYSNESIETMKKNGRICCQEHFYKFFTYDTDSESISLTEMNNIIEKAEHLEDFSNILLDLNSKDKIKIFLESFENYVNDLSVTKVKNVIKSLLNLGDYFKLHDTGFWSTNTYFYINRILIKLLGRRNVSNTFEILKDCLSNNKSIYPATHFMALIYSSLTRNKGQFETGNIDDESYKELANIVLTELYQWKDNDLNNIEDNTKPFNGKLINHRMYLSLLYFWMNNGDKQALSDYISFYSDNNDRLLALLSKFSYKRKCYSGTKYHEYDAINRKDLETFFNDLNELEQRLIELQKTELSNENKATIELVINSINYKEQDI